MSDRSSPMGDEATEEMLEGFHPEEFGYATWTEMLPVFARGSMVYVDPELNFKDVAAAVESDDSEKVTAWMSSGLVHNVTDEQAKQWTQKDALMFRFLIRQPLVLAQPIPFEAKH